MDESIGRRRTHDLSVKHRRETFQIRTHHRASHASAERSKDMGVRDYVAQRSDQIDQGKDDVLTAITSLHATQRTVLELRQKAQIERLREPDDSLAVAIQENIASLRVLEKAFTDVVDAAEALPFGFSQADAAEKRLEAALPSTNGPPGPPSSS